MPSDPKTKIRPQQSCFKCRERKVKCDRSIPCHACIIRGIEAECTYLTTPEDREHIGQAEIIDRLRREVAQLRTQLTQGPKPKSKPLSDRNRAPYSRPTGYVKHGSLQESDNVLRGGEEVAGMIGAAGSGVGAGAGIGAGTDFGDASWSGSSSSSTGTRTYSAMTVNSPDSMGSGPSESHAGFSATTAPFGTQIGAGDAISTGTGTGTVFVGASLMDSSCLSNSQAGGIPAFAHGDIPASILMQNIHAQSSADLSSMPVAQVYQHETPHNYTMEDQITTQYAHPDHSPDYLQGNLDPLNSNMATVSDYKQAQTYHQGQEQHPHYSQWEQAHNFAPVQPYAESAYYSSPSSNNAAVHTTMAQDPNPNSNIHHSQQALHIQSSSTHFPLHENHPLSGEPIPSSWKVDGKQELLETLLETIGSCEEVRVAQVVQVVRASATPEEAVSGICQVLGISAVAR
ncbi:transcriptional regulator family: Fungal Specific TF [Penicillium angulare]|uniref:transcriptional regulator family: Fungal Specific TF n=1 Tax=Penicillium angulare TaxID=116970 RepID=UPI00253F9E55|nr:transcriptional regulator family: Fungal Specific TF [Penicillium angulare]KAJ5279156.1 transcriptional regulator family: Fungal Specific TF [Penicillium angulare]